MNSEKPVTDLNTLQEIIKNQSAVLLYFTAGACNVDEALAPKIYKLITTEFPNIRIIDININATPEISAAFQVFTNPTILVFFEGKETIRKSRNIGLNELKLAIERPYGFIFE